jgi:hypothetical protein
MDAHDRCHSGSGRTLAGISILDAGMEREDFMIRIAGSLLVAVVAGYGVYAFAQIRADVRPAVAPIGSSSSNGMSFAWFYDSTERAVFVCRIGQAPGDAVDCRAKTNLP